jgi:hypothetical protein
MEFVFPPGQSLSGARRVNRDWSKASWIRPPSLYLPPYGRDDNVKAGTSVLLPGADHEARRQPG